MSKPMKNIPISAAAHIARLYGYDQVIIYARKIGTTPEPHGEHMTSYGVNTEHCNAAALIAKALQKFVGWTKEGTVE